MKLRAIKPFATVALGLWVAVSLATAAVRAGDDTPKPAASATPKGKKSKERKDTADATLAPKIKKPKEIPFPVPVNQPFKKITVPSYNQVGVLLNVLSALKGNRVDNEHVQLEGANFDLNDANGNPEYKIELPVSTLNLVTNNISSDHPITIRTKEFELTGEKMDFNTVERSGELRGHVHMRIYNIKQLTTPGNDKPAPK